MSKVTPEKKAVFDFVDKNERWISDFHQEIWHYAEPAWREYKSVKAYIELLRKEGFQVEEGSGEMPTAFYAVWGEGRPIIGGFAEYDAVPGYNQAATPYKALRDESLHPWAPGHTDPHSALGVASLFGFISAKRAMEEHGLKGTLKFFGEPAEKVCGSKAVHAAKGYFDDFDAATLYHPSGVNNVIYNIPFASYWSQVYTFETINPEKWFRPSGGPLRMGGRAPAALDAVCLMYTTTKYTKEAMLPHTGNWTLNEFLMVGGECTSDNVPPKMGQIQYAFRCPTLTMQEQIDKVLDNNAKGVGMITGTKVTKRIVARTRVGLPNLALSEIVYENLKLAGSPKYDEKAKKIGRKIQENLGLEPMKKPFMKECEEIMTLEETDRRSRSMLPPWVETTGSDDYVEYTWTCPGIRFHTARAVLRPYPNYDYPGWTRIAMGGMRETIDPMIFTCSKTMGASIVELITSPEKLKRCKEEFKERTGGGIGGSKWVAPLLSRDFVPPIDLPWPEYVTTIRGTEWHLTKPGPAKEYKVLYEGL